uniref:Uncharacterized protein n=1 Tax=Oryza sativa subsp. japonica TaxID=39947 RepID=Q6ERC1_ORYSJ|nr:hypothetical protein [Oryza sativa Japonica Group]BAD28799.1 hypothetical protein [Oryza sativa Japonica Group]
MVVSGILDPAARAEMISHIQRPPLAAESLPGSIQAWKLHKRESGVGCFRRGGSGDRSRPWRWSPDWHGNQGQVISLNTDDAAGQQAYQDLLEQLVGHQNGVVSPQLSLTDLKALSMLSHGTKGVNTVPADAATTGATTDEGTRCPPDVDPWLSRPSTVAPFPLRRRSHG